MSDPAEEAAMRAWDAAGLDGPRLPMPRSVRIAAREALAPLRELHHKGDEQGELVCVYCMGHDGWHLDWPCDTARLIYSTEELS